MTARAEDLSAPAPTDDRFTVRLHNFEGPFDLLLQLISRHKLDVTEVALSIVTDEFIAHIRAMGSEWDLDQTSQFVVVAATLLDLKAARLLPQGDVEDPEDLALLEARDLLFARLLQYRAFKLVSGWLGETLTEQGRRFPRPGGLEPQFAALLPEVDIPLDAAQFALLAGKAMAPRQEQHVSLEHLHAVTVSVREQAGLLIERLREHGTLTFRSLVRDAPDRLHVVARFLALLELSREGSASVDQLTPRGDLTTRWTGDEHAEIDISDEFDGGAPAAEEQASE